MVAFPAPTRRLAATLLPLSLLLAAPALRAADLAARTLHGEVRVVEGATGPVVQGPAGERVALPLSRRAAVTALAAAADRWYAAAVEPRGGRPALVLLTGYGERVRELPAPATAGEAIVMAPALLADAAGLNGVAWLEGPSPDRLTVWVAWRQDRGWGRAAPLAAPRSGSQLALSAAPLPDGTFLLAWSAFDGTDDEILWSRSTPERGWTTPQRVAPDDAVPDVTPRLTATRGGALLAWSHYDGEGYRVEVATFAAGRWSAPRVVGPRGSVDPTFRAGPERPLLLYRTAVPRGWAAVEVDGDGRALRRAELPTADRRAPFVDAADGDGVALVWPGTASSATRLPWRRDG